MHEQHTQRTHNGTCTYKHIKPRKLLLEATKKYRTPKWSLITYTMHACLITLIDYSYWYIHPLHEMHCRCTKWIFAFFHLYVIFSEMIVFHPVIVFFVVSVSPDFHSPWSRAIQAYCKSHCYYYFSHRLFWTNFVLFLFLFLHLSLSTSLFLPRSLPFSLPLSPSLSLPPLLTLVHFRSVFPLFLSFALYLECCLVFVAIFLFDSLRISSSESSHTVCVLHWNWKCRVSMHSHVIAM